MNMVWEWSEYYASGTTKYYTSNIDQNLNSIFYKTGYTHIVDSVVTVKMN